jgi:autotransporter family porin
VILAYVATVALALGAGSAAGASAAPPHVRNSPTISGTALVGDALHAHAGRWIRAKSLAFRWERCGSRGAGCKLIPGRRGSRRAYALSRADQGHRIRLIVTARNRWGHTAATSRETGVIAAAGGPGTSPSPSPTSPSPTSPSPTSPSPTAPGGSSVDYFATVPSSQTGSPPAGIPRSDATCASVVPSEAEVRPQNATANHTVPPSPASVTWSPNLSYWTKFIADRDDVTGDYTGTTDQILEWVSCKWGIDVDLIRADAWVESGWYQSTMGNNCGTAGEASYGVLQVMNKNCSGDWVNGGYPYTQDDTALDADYWGADIRACYDGAFYNGGSWLYNGQTIAQVIAQHGDPYALWGCIGFWASGAWYTSGAQTYINTVQSDYTSQPWRSIGAP